jgi:hypothetical protein
LTVPGAHAGLSILAVLPDFPGLEDVVAGDRVRSLELLTTLGDMGYPAHVLTFASTTPAQSSHPNVSTGSLPFDAERLSDVPALAAVTRALWRHAAATRARSSRPVLYVKVPGGLYMRGGLAPVHSNPVHLLVPLARRMGFLIWTTVHDLSPDHDLAMLARRRRNGEGIPDAPPGRLRRAWALGAAEASWLFRRSDLVTVVSEGMRRAVVHRSGVPAERVVVATTGVNPALVGPVPAWTAPGPGDQVTLAYLGSAYDVELGTILAAVGMAAQATGVPLVLRLSAGPPVRPVLPDKVTVEVMGSRYAAFPEYASGVDIWLNCFAREDEYIMEMGSPIKLPMYIASGRPTVTTAGPYLERDGLRPWVVTAGSTEQELAAAIVAVLVDLPAARNRASAARDHILETRTWYATARCIADRLDSLATSSPR